MIEAIGQNTTIQTPASPIRTKQASGVSFAQCLEETQTPATQEKTRTLNDIFEEASKKYDVPLNLLKAVAMQESSFKTDAVSHAGAQGLMQLMPATARELGVTDSFDPEQNVMGGAKYLSQMLKKYNGNVKLALAAYNAGSNNVAKYGGVPPFKETQDYVVKVMNYMNQDLVIPGTTVKSQPGPGSTKIPEVERPETRKEEKKVLTENQETTADAPDAIFSYEDYEEFLSIWEQQLNLFRVESNLYKMQELFQRDDEEDAK